MASAPIDATPVSSKMGVHVCAPFVLFQTPPPGEPK